MATKKKSTKKAVKKTTAKKATKKVASTKKKVAKKPVKKTTATKKATARKTCKCAEKSTPSKGTYKIPIIQGANTYFKELGDSINRAARDGYGKIEYYDNDFGIRAQVKGKKIIIETGFSNSFANIVESGGYKICEYEPNYKKLRGTESATRETNDYDDVDEDDEDDEEEDDDDY